MLLGFRSTLLSSFSPAALFAAGEQGVWYDPSDMTTLFQDSAGTTPVTAVEQPVGRMLDKSGRGNHATQATPSARPVLSARVNLLTKTEQFNDAVWTKSATTISVDSIAGPDGTTTADTIINTTATSNHGVYATIAGMASSVPNRVVFHVKKSTVRYISIGLWNAGGNCGAGFDLDTNTVTGTGATGVGYSASNAAVTVLSDGWLRLSVTCIAPDTTNYPAMLQRNTAYTSGSIIEIYVGTTSQSTYIWGADLRVANDTALPVYQRVDTSTSYDTTGFPMYLRFDGSDDSMATASINFTSTDKMTVFGGVRKLSDAALGVMAELSANSDSTNGTFILYNNAATLYFATNNRGTAIVGIGTSSITYAGPYSAVLNSNLSITPAGTNLQVNGTQVATSAATVGTGNYGNHPLFIGSRNQASLRFNGRIYSLIVRGAATTESLIEQTENWISGEMGGGYYPTGFDFLVNANGDQLTDASGNPIITQAYY